jgi:hypothetical protein
MIVRLAAFSTATFSILEPLLDLRTIKKMPASTMTNPIIHFMVVLIINSSLQK